MSGREKEIKQVAAELGDLLDQLQAAVDQLEASLLDPPPGDGGQSPAEVPAP